MVTSVAWVASLDTYQLGSHACQYQHICFVWHLCPLHEYCTHTTWDITMTQSAHCQSACSCVHTSCLYLEQCLHSTYTAFISCSIASTVFGLQAPVGLTHSPEEQLVPVVQPLLLQPVISPCFLCGDRSAATSWPSLTVPLALVSLGSSMCRLVLVSSSG